MPDIKHHFRSGRMNKDLDERLVPNGEYRDAQNIEIITSEGSGVGSVQNVIGNTLKDGRVYNESSKALTLWGNNSSSIKDLTSNGQEPQCIGHVVDEQNNKVYWFISSGSTVTANTSPSTSTAKVNGAITTSSTINLDNVSGTIATGDIVTGTGVKGLVTVTSASTPSNNTQVIFISSLETISNDIDLTFTKVTGTIAITSASSEVKVGMTVIGGGIVGKTTVTSVSGSNITLSNNVYISDNTLLTFTLSVSCIAEFDTTTGVIKPVLVDKNNILKFSSSYLITGVNVLNGLLLWTDDQYEPKKINISTFKSGSTTFNYHTQYNGSDFKEKDITVIKLSPLNTVDLTMSSSERLLNSYGLEGGPAVFIRLNLDGKSYGDEVTLNFGTGANFIKDDIIKLTYSNSSGTTTDTGVSEVRLKVKFLISSKKIQEGDIDVATYQAKCIVQDAPALLTLGSVFWTVVLQEKNPLFEEKFVRFAYRWKYSDNQYSTFSPFSKTAFLPSTFEYTSLDAYNNGMSNNLRLLKLSGFDVQPADVVSVDILMKESNNNTIYILDTLKNRETSYNVISENIRSVVESNQILRPWDNVPKRAKAQEVSSNRVIYANYYQGYDMINNNIPKIETTVNQSSANITTNSVANSLSDSDKYELTGKNDDITVGMTVKGKGITENTFVKSIDKTNPEKPIITVEIINKTNKTIFEIDKNKSNDSITNTTLFFSKIKTPSESVKSQRTYQLGATYSDIYGRESPVFSSSNSSVKLDKSYCNTKNILTGQLTNSAPSWATHYKFFVKETSSEYYNLALDRFYFSNDGNVWLSFPSAERNKVSEENYLVLKKKHDKNDAIIEDARYKILDISNEAPRFISTEIVAAGKASCEILDNSQPAVGNVFFEFAGPSPQENPSFAEAFRSKNQIEITTNVDTGDFEDQRNSKRYTIKSGGSSNSNVYTIELENPISPEDSNILTDLSSKTTASTAAGVSSSVSVTLSEANSLILPNMVVSGEGIDGQVSVVSITGTSLTLSSVQTIASGVTLSFITNYVSFGKEINITIFEKQVKDKDEFFGRFFVKINRDYIIDDNIINSFNAVKSTFEPISKQKIYENIPGTSYTNKDDGETTFSQNAAWSDSNVRDEHDQLSKTIAETHPQMGTTSFSFYWSGIKTETGFDDGSENVNHFITNLTKKGSLIQFSNSYGRKGGIYQVVDSSFKTEFRSSSESIQAKSYGKRRLYKITINKYGKIGAKIKYSDSFESALGSNDSSGNGRIDNISIMKESLSIGDDTFSSENPAIFETEPKTLEGLDIYYEATNSLPIIKSGMQVTGEGVGSSNFVNSIEDGDRFNLLNFPTGTIAAGTILTFTDKDNQYSFTAKTHGSEIVQTPQPSSEITLESNQVHGQVNIVPWFNCYSFGQGVESNRIKDDFNAVTIDKGAIVSTTLESEYREEHKPNGFIWSGIFNSTSGVNELNQFIQALSITKNINPVHGSIQKLHSRETDLITFCEDKVLKILANKNALFNADGNTNLTSSNNVLGQSIAYLGEYGISKNPESFSSHAFRVYFADKARGAILRLSRDGLTDVSEKGMSDFFGDNIPLSTNILGSYDETKALYNITLNNKTVSFSEKVDGWTSFKSFIPEAGFSINDIYYTFKNGDLYSHDNLVRNTFYDVAYETSVNVLFNDIPASIKSFKTLNYEGSDSRKYTYGGTITKDALGNSLSSNITIGAGTTLDVLKNVNYAPNQIKELTETETKGWYADSIATDQQTGSVRFFKEKENFKFNKILGDNTVASNIDTKELSVQGLGVPASVSDSGAVDKVLTVTPSITLVNFTISSSVTFSASGTIGLGKTAVFTITPSAGYVISASQVTGSNSLSNIESVSDADTGIAGNIGNTVEVTFVMVNESIANTATIEPTISVSTLSLKQYNVTGVYNTDEANTLNSSSLYNLGYNGSGDYFVNSSIDGTSTDSSPVLHLANPLISVNMAVIGSGITNGTLVNSISGKNLTLKSLTESSVSATIPDDTILKFGKLILTRKFEAENEHEFTSAPTLDIINQDTNDISEYASANDWSSFSTTGKVLNDTGKIITVSSSAGILPGMVLSSDSIVDYVKVVSINSLLVTLDTTIKITSNETLNFNPSVVNLNVYYVFSSNNPISDELLITAKATKAFIGNLDEITKFEMSETPIPVNGESRFIRVSGKPNSSFLLNRSALNKDKSFIKVNAGSSSSQNSFTIKEANFAIQPNMRITTGISKQIGFVKELSSDGLTVSMYNNFEIANNSEVRFNYFLQSGGGFEVMSQFNKNHLVIPDAGTKELIVNYLKSTNSAIYHYTVLPVSPSIISDSFTSSNLSDNTSRTISVSQLKESTLTLTAKESVNFIDSTCDVTQTGNDAAKKIVAHDANSRIVVGLAVSGAGIPAGSFIASVTDTTHFVLSAVPTAANNNTPLTFKNVELGGTTVERITGTALQNLADDEVEELTFEFKIFTNSPSSNVTCTFNQTNVFSDHFFKYDTVETTISGSGSGVDVAGGFEQVILINEPINNALVAGTEITGSRVKAPNRPLPEGTYLKSINGVNSVTIANPNKSINDLQPWSYSAGEILVFSAPGDWELDFTSISTTLIPDSTGNNTGCTVNGKVLIKKFGNTNLDSDFDFFDFLNTESVSDSDDVVVVKDIKSYALKPIQQSLDVNSVISQQLTLGNIRLLDHPIGNPSKIYIGKGTSSNSDGIIDTNSSSAFITENDDDLVVNTVRIDVTRPDSYEGFWRLELTPTGTNIDTFGITTDGTAPDGGKFTGSFGNNPSNGGIRQVNYQDPLNTGFNDGSNSNGTQTYLLSFTSKASKDIALSDTLAISWLLNIQMATERVHFFENDPDDANGTVNDPNGEKKLGGSAGVIET